GLGTSDAIQKVQFLGQMMQAQMALMQSPMGPMLVSPQTVFNLQARIAENAGFKNPREFWVDPDTVPPPPQNNEPPLPLQIKQMEIQADMQKLQIEMKSEMQAKQAEIQANIEKARAQNEIQAMNDQRDAERELMKARYQAQIEEQKIAFEKWKAELDARVKLRVAAIGKESGDELLNAVGEAEVFEKPSPIDQLAAMHQQTLETIGQLAAQMNRPKQVIRGDDGKVIGVA
ncbi:hypothetical protein RZS08_06300, partial [Arthrospira platensis SPKY1]|nr:hypothetical protein [Arthrospira platensis SPKY1]